MLQLLTSLKRLSRRLRFDREGDLLSLALNNVTQGLVMLDAAGRLVLCNDQYIAMYGPSPAVVRPGISFPDLIRHRVSTGSLHRDPAKCCAELMESMAGGRVARFVVDAPNGRAVLVVNRPIPGGRYWVGTHDDITDRLLAERKTALLEEPAVRRALVEEAVRTFRESVEGVFKTVADSVAAMKLTATALSTTSRETTLQTAGAVHTSNDAFGNVKGAATATEELSNSIAEINSQLVRASEVVRAAARSAVDQRKDRQSRPSGEEDRRCGQAHSKRRRAD